MATAVRGTVKYLGTGGGPCPIRKAAIFPGDRQGEDIKRNEIVVVKSKQVVEHTHTDGILHNTNFYELADGRGWIHDFHPSDSDVRQIEEIDVEVATEKPTVPPLNLSTDARGVAYDGLPVVQPILRAPGGDARFKVTVIELAERDQLSVWNAFAKYDRDESGEMDIKEVPTLLTELGLPLDDLTLKLFLDATFPPGIEGARDWSGGITKLEVVNLYRSILANQPHSVRKNRAGRRLRVADLKLNESALRDCFNEADKDNSGHLNHLEICFVLEKLGIPDTKGDRYDSFLIDEFEKIDTNNDQQISFPEFVIFLNAALASQMSDLQSQHRVAAPDPATARTRAARDWEFSTPRSATRDWKTPRTPRQASPRRGGRTPRPL